MPSMIFSDFYKGPKSPLAKLRHSQQHLPPTTPDWVGDEHADLLSRDKAKSKAAVKRYLAAKIKNDWIFTWPPEAVKSQQSQAVQDVANTPHSQLKPEQVEAAPLDGAAKDKEVDPKPHVPQVASADAASSLSVQSAGPVQDEMGDDDGYRVDDDADLSDDSVQGSARDNQDDAESIYSIVSEDAVHFQPRLDWASDLSDDDAIKPPVSPYRFETPDAVGSSVFANIQKKRAQRRREVREEIAWNEGLACFEARRNAWTGARTVRVRAKPASPAAAASPRSPRRLFFRRSMSASPPASTSTTSHPHSGDGSAAMSDGSSVGKDDDKELSKQQTCDTTPSTPPSIHEYTVQTLLPVAPPLLPPGNPLRAAISPSLYLSLYDKVIIHSLQPSCPINLSDMLQSCVAGWKRDGEWPPQPVPVESTLAMRKKKKAASSDNTGSVARRMSFGLLGRDKDDDSKAGKGIRRSLQRALGFGGSHANETTTGAEKKT
ncbi:hypothetical protein HJFPF1_07921 [Paramyrothecium foliicola]|nr:hypothetical protein HJFPF1_07921 [Paramyrothecium foliicola]